MPTPNPTTRREYKGGALATTLNGAITNAATSFLLTANTGWPTGAVGTFIVTVDRGLATEERILCSAQTSGTVTVAAAGRGFDNTAAQAHSNLATVECTLSGFDADEWNQHTNATAAVHGVAGAVVGTSDTQTLTNKTLTAPAISGTLAGSPTFSGTPQFNANFKGATGLTLTLPAATDTLVGRATTDTLTNKTLTSPTITTPTVNGSGGALTLPAGPDTLVGRATTDTLTNKTLTSPAINFPTITTPTMTGTVARPATAANQAMVVKGLASQSGNLEEWQSSTGAVLARVDPGGSFTANAFMVTDGRRAIIATVGAQRVVDAASVTFTTDATGAATFNHFAGSVPQSVVLTDTLGPTQPRVTATTSTTVTVGVRNQTGDAVLANTTLTYYYMVVA